MAFFILNSQLFLAIVFFLATDLSVGIFCAIGSTDYGSLGY